MDEPRQISRHARELAIEPLDATFRDSNRAPLHSWFPYLEGYSPRFVERVRAEYLPRATQVLEPFAGSGTTPLVLSQLGVRCAYAEVNPAMAFVVATKLAVLALSQRKRRDLARRLAVLATDLPARLRASRADHGLRGAYAETFGTSVFFDPRALQQILRLRTVCDVVHADDPIVGDCLALAVLASLIPTSRLERAGDLRFKTPRELARGLPLPLEAVQQRLFAQAGDLPHAAKLVEEATFVCDGAAALAEHVATEWDGVITSPPYLNGTNYIRNARLELWFLRRLRSKADLRALRDRVVTSGINDVDAHTRWAPVTPGVEHVVRDLTARAYDARIAKMVGGYFVDMAAVLASLKRCLRPGARACVDIGDSIYAGIHVPTDDLLVEVAEQTGFRTIERVHLRARLSKGGRAVRQQLLVFEQPRHSRRARRPAEPWRGRWEEFKRTLPHQQQPYAKREWGGPVHSMCSYQGKIKPALAHHLVDCFTAAGDVVIDPFSGAGTIPFEACRMQRQGFGIDISRLGHVLTLAKVARAEQRSLERLLRSLATAVETHVPSADDYAQAAAVRFNGAIPDYFHPETLREVLAARHFFTTRWDSGPEWALLCACTLHLLHGNRPYALSRRSHPVTPFKPSGPVEYRALLPRLREKLARVVDEVTSATRTFGGCVQTDCTLPWPCDLPRANAIITSPPFFDSTRFYMTNWMRYWFVGWQRDDFVTCTRDFVENRQRTDLDVYKSWFAAARAHVTDTGVVVLHLGHSPKCDMATELAARVQPWFRVADQFTEGVGHCESHGVRDKGTVAGHTYLVLQPT